MSHSSVPGQSKTPHLSLAGYIGLVIAGIVLTLVVILPVFGVIILPALDFAGQIANRVDWPILLVPLGGLAYFVYRRRLRSKRWWLASRLVVWLTFGAIVFWLYFNVFPESAGRSKTAILTILVILMTPVLQRLYGNKETGDLLERIDRLSSKIRLNLAVAADYNERGYDYLELGDQQKAVLDFARAIELEPQYAVAHNNRGLAYHYQGKSAEALADLNRAIALKPDYADAYNNRGLVYSRQGRFDEAIGEYTHALEIEPNFALVYHNRGLDYYKIGEFEKALADLQTSKRLAGNHFSVEAQRLVAQLEKGRFPRPG